MAENSGVSWTDNTHNEWIGCDQISPACDFCYAKSLVENRMGKDFAERWLTSESNRRKPHSWNRNHAAFFAEHGRRLRVFAHSLSDVADNQVPQEWTDGLCDTIEATPNLDWMMLSKRPQNYKKRFRRWRNGWPPNVWLGFTAEDQKRFDQRWRHVAELPVRVKFISAEPLLERLTLPASALTELKWVIAGGENAGPSSRLSHPSWFIALRDQCAQAGIAFHFKQWGSWRPPQPDEWFNTLKGRAGKPPAFIMESTGHVHCTGFTAGMTDARPMIRVGVDKAGRLLDGREHNEFPRIAA